MKNLIDFFAKMALEKDLENPNDSLVMIIKSNDQLQKPEMIKRLIEAFNVNSFLRRQTSGFDMEDSFPIASPREIMARLLKDELGSSMSCLNSLDVPPIERTGDGEVTVTITKKASDPEEPSQEDVDRARTLYKYAMSSCLEYLRNFDSILSKNASFVSELRYLYPDSMILNEAGLSKGKKIACYEGRDHAEFHAAESFLKKWGAKKKEDSQPKSQKSYATPGQKNIADVEDAIYYQKMKDLRGDLEEYPTKKKDIDYSNSAEQMRADSIEDLRRHTRDSIDLDSSSLQGNLKTHRDSYLRALSDTALSPQDVESAKKNYLDAKSRLDTYRKLREEEIPDEYTPRLEKQDDILGRQLSLMREREDTLSRRLPSKDFWNYYPKIRESLGNLVPTGYFQDQYSRGKTFLKDISPNPFTIATIPILERERNISLMKEERDKNLKDVLSKIKEVALFDRVSKDPRLENVDKSFLLGAFKNFRDTAPYATMNEGLMTNLLVNASTFGTKDIDPAVYKTLSEIESNYGKSKYYSSQSVTGVPVGQAYKVFGEFSKKEDKKDGTKD